MSPEQGLFFDSLLDSREDAAYSDGRRKEGGIEMDRLEELKKDFESQPLVGFLGLVLEKLAEGFAVVRCSVRPEFLVTAGMVQGGITFTIADFAGVYAAMSRIPTGHTPLKRIEFGGYHRPITEDSVIRAIGRVIDDDERSLKILVKVYGSDDEKKAEFILAFAKPR